MDPYKIERQSSAIRKTLSDLIAMEVKDHRVGFVQVNEVRLNRDQTVAEVYFSVLGDDAQELDDSFEGLKKARGFLQGRIADILRLRRTPDLRFVPDNAVERGLGIEAILHDLSEKGEFDDETARNSKRELDSLMPPLDLLKALATGQRFWVVPHWNPDPDAMGSALALTRALKIMGKQAQAIVFPDPPAGFAALPGFEDALSSEEAPEFLAQSPVDTVIMVDCHGLDRAEDMAPLLEGIPQAWCIDHHLVDDHGQSLPGWIEAVASSASLLVMRVIEVLGSGEVEEVAPFELGADMAANLYAGLVTDTGGFRFPNTLPMTFEAARRLSATGIDVAALGEEVLHRRTRAGVELLKAVMGTLEFHAGGKIVSLRTDRAMLEETGATLADSEGFVNIATSIVGVGFAVFMKERPDGKWRISLRSVNGGDVQSVAAARGGGGHRLAAGLTMSGTAEDVLEDLLPDLENQLES